MVAASGSVVDHRAYDNASAAACAFDYCYREPQDVADAAIDDVCRRAKCEMTARTYNRPGVFRNCWRQFDAENLLARRLRRFRGQFELALAVSEDVAPLRKLSA